MIDFIIKTYLLYEWDLVSGTLLLIAIISFILALFALVTLNKKE